MPDNPNHADSTGKDTALHSCDSASFAVRVCCKVQQCLLCCNMHLLQCDNQLSAQNAHCEASLKVSTHALNAHNLAQPPTPAQHAQRRNPLRVVAVATLLQAQLPK